MPRHPRSPSHSVVALVLVVACTSERRAADTTATHSPPAAVAEQAVEQAAEQAAAETTAAVLTPADTSAAAVLAAVRLHGAPRVLHVIFDEQAREERLYDGVSRGDSGWLAVVAAVMPDADGDAVETIDDALRLALPRAPVRVLRLLADSTTHTEVWWACLSPSAAGIRTRWPSPSCGARPRPCRRFAIPPSPPCARPVSRSCGRQRTARRAPDATSTLAAAAAVARLLRHLVAILLLPFVVVVIAPGWLTHAYAARDTRWASGAAAWVGHGAGAATFAAGFALFAWCVALFARVGEGTLAPWDPTRRLVTAGPYRYVRNPMIVGVALMLAGEALLHGSRVLAAWCAVFLLINQSYFLLLEEPGLERRFGESYRRYRAAVPRWVPRRTPWDGG